MANWDIFIQRSPKGLVKPYDTIVTREAIEFIAELAVEFKKRFELVSSTVIQKMCKNLKRFKFLKLF